AHVGVTRTERLFADDQRALEEPLRVFVLALVLIYEGQVVEGLTHFGVVRTERLLPDRQSALVQPFSLAVLAFSPSSQTPAVESLSCSRGHALGFCLLFVVALRRSYRVQIMSGRGHVGMARA